LLIRKPRSMRIMAWWSLCNSRRALSLPEIPIESISTVSLLRWIVLLQTGDTSAAEPEFQRIMKSVRRLALASFRKFPRVARFTELDDIVNGSMVRLLSALRTIRPANTQEFYAVSNAMIRRELLDLIKKFYGPNGAGTNETIVVVGSGNGDHDPMSITEDLDRMTAFHEAVEQLPAEEREAISLRYYHSWSQAEIANLFGLV
jgi:RNA polymerase sigma factor (sigma-70 family)